MVPIPGHVQTDPLPNRTPAETASFNAVLQHTLLLDPHPLTMTMACAFERIVCFNALLVCSTAMFVDDVKHETQVHPMETAT